jgi:hypothetical protein
MTWDATCTMTMFLYFWQHVTTLCSVLKCMLYIPLFTSSSKVLRRPARSKRCQHLWFTWCCAIGPTATCVLGVGLGDILSDDDDNQRSFSCLRLKINCPPAAKCSIATFLSWCDCVIISDNNACAVCSSVIRVSGRSEVLLLSTYLSHPDFADFVP